jgi:hypothetical protein
MRVTSNTMNTSSVHFSLWCPSADKDAGVTAIDEAVRHQVVELYTRIKTIYDHVINGISVVSETDVTLPQSGDLEL